MNLPEIAIAADLRIACGIAPRTLTFLPIGNDSGSAAYRIDCADGAGFKSRFAPGNIVEIAMGL